MQVQFHPLYKAIYISINNVGGFYCIFGIGTITLFSVYKGTIAATLRKHLLYFTLSNAYTCQVLQLIIASKMGNYSNVVLKNTLNTVKY